MTTSIQLVWTTCATVDQARGLARLLVERRLAACVSLGTGVESVFPWQGRIEQVAEVVLLIKTTAARLPALKQALTEEHPYEVPEMLVVNTDDGLPDYLEWARHWLEGGN